ncbi:hypothetical protein WG899_19780 [Paucibacter sp. AS339]|uniref:hypothetical protein n=1 Tax=Paucibacter hankyongi TaxID=3133434 RepID=UPI0030ACBDE5
MLAKLTSKNQLTLPKSVTDPLGPVQYFEVQTKAGQIILTPVKIQRGDALRAKLAELAIDEKTIESALNWAQPAKKTVSKKSAEKAPAKPQENPARKTAVKTAEKGAPAKAAVTAKKTAAKPSSAKTAAKNTASSGRSLGKAMPASNKSSASRGGSVAASSNRRTAVPR